MFNLNNLSKGEKVDYFVEIGTYFGVRSKSHIYVIGVKYVIDAFGELL
ncbi:hypothetical protein [uncultured Anaerococcus sp.]|nr:hypothetical protein [uncultured Anaerococcus sp.]